MDMVHNMTARVGLVHQMPFTYDRPGFVSVLEKVRRSQSSSAAGRHRGFCRWGVEEVSRVAGFGGEVWICSYTLRPGIASMRPCG